MNIVDLSLWIEFFLDNDIDPSVKAVIKDYGNVYVPVISLYEVYKKFLSIGDTERASMAVGIMQKARVSGITPELAVLAAELGKQHRLPMADSIIYATAVQYEAEIYTQDKHFEGLERVYYFAK